MRAKLNLAAWLNFDESKIAAAGVLGERISRLMSGVYDSPSANVRGAVMELANNLAEEEKRHIRRMLKSLPHVRAEGRRGRSAKVTTVQVRAVLAKRGRVTQEEEAHLLKCEVSAVKRWAKHSEWGTMSLAGGVAGKARCLLLGHARESFNEQV